MAESMPASLTLYVPKGGDEAFATLMEAHTSNDPKKTELVRLIATEGGTITFRDNDASWGRVDIEEDLEKPEFAHLDFDAHNDAKYEYEAERRYRRKGKTTSRASDNGGGVLLTKSDIRKALRGAKTVQDARKRLYARFKDPPVSYKVGPHALEEDW